LEFSFHKVTMGFNGVVRRFALDLWQFLLKHAFYLANRKSRALATDGLIEAHSDWA